MGTKLGPSYANLFLGYIAHQFFNQYDGPKPELYRCYIDDCVGNTSSTREKLDQFLSRYQSFRRRQRSVCTTNRLIIMVLCYIHLYIHHMSRIPFLILGFLDFVAFVVRSLIFP